MIADIRQGDPPPDTLLRGGQNRRLAWGLCFLRVCRGVVFLEVIRAYDGGVKTAYAYGDLLFSLGEIL